MNVHEITENAIALSRSIEEMELEYPGIEFCDGYCPKGKSIHVFKGIEKLSLFLREELQSKPFECDDLKTTEKSFSHNGVLFFQIGDRRMNNE